MWHPLYDDLVALWAETVDGELPYLVIRDGVETVGGGWPARRFPDGWAARRAEWLTRCAGHAWTRPPLQPASALEEQLHPAPAGPRGSRATRVLLSGRDVGWVRRALANTVTRARRPRQRGPRAALRAVQAVDRRAGRRMRRGRTSSPAGSTASLRTAASRPSTRSSGTSERGGGRPAIGGDVAVPTSVIRKVSRALEAPVEELIDRGVIGSGEVLARVLPQVSAQYVSPRASANPSIADCMPAYVQRVPAPAQPAAAQPREHRWEFEELPWVCSPVPAFASQGPLDAARPGGAASEAVVLALDSFPERDLPPTRWCASSAALATAGGGVRLALVEEVAADIFMGTSRRSGGTAAEVAGEEPAGGSLYARYFDLSGPEGLVLLAQVVGWTRQLPRGAARRRPTDFDRRCAEPVRATRGRVGTAARWSVAANGTVLEQSQILAAQPGRADRRTRPGAPPPGGSAGTGRPGAGLGAPDPAHLPSQHRAALQAVENIAYAWRQAMYLLSFCADDGSQTAAVRRLLEAAETGTPGGCGRSSKDWLTWLPAAASTQPASPTVEPDDDCWAGGWGPHWLLRPVAGLAR